MATNTSGKKMAIRILGVALIVCVAVGIGFSCVGANGADLKPLKLPLQIQDGTYTGTAVKVFWDLNVELVVKDGKMAEINMLRHVGPKKHTELVRKIGPIMLEKQTPDVDDISGATMSSRAFKRAMRDALSRAGQPMDQ